MVSPHVLLVLSCVFLTVRRMPYPTGAPAEACADIYPQGHVGPGLADSQELSNNPFHLDLSDLDHFHGGSIYYVQGRTYTLTLSGSGGKQFRGFLVQARTVADGSPVGAFADIGQDQALSCCTPAESAVTHSNRDFKSSVTFSWTAPPNEAGQLHILYAIVGEFNHSIGHSIFWAPVTTDIILSCGPLLYWHEGNCVEVCPLQHFGNSTSGLCEPFANDYIIHLNATQYYGHFNSETPINTPAFNMQLSINQNTVTLQDIDEITFSFSQTRLVQDLFEFKHGGGENQFIATNHAQNVSVDTAVVNATILLIALPNKTYYPIDIDMTLSVFLVHSNDQFTTTKARAVGSIVLAPGACDVYVCQNGGTCTDTNSTYFTCECPYGFTGWSCNESIPKLDACQLLEPCVNGTCNASDSIEYTCTCYSGYTGDNCSEHICEQLECKNGICTEKDGNVSCHCDLGYTGHSCDSAINDCYLNGCSGNGNCTEFSAGNWHCECFPGLTGMWCDTILPCDPNPCANAAVCYDNNGTVECICTPGWTGPHCDHAKVANVCKDNPCFHGGTCSIICPSEEGCSNETERQHRCLCIVGYTGETCNEDDPAIMFCQPDTCANSGTCIEGHGPNVSCLCASNFSGPACTDMTTNNEDTCSQAMLGGEAIIALICAVTLVIIVGMTGTFITIVLAVRYQTKAKAKRNQVSNDLIRETSCRVFPNTNAETGIYFDGSGGHRGSPLLGSESLIVSSSPPTTLKAPEQPRHRQESVNSQQSRETPNPCMVQNFSSDNMSQMTAVSDYEQPVNCMRRYRQQNPQHSHRLSFVCSQYESVL